MKTFTITKLVPVFLSFLIFAINGCGDSQQTSLPTDKEANKGSQQGEEKHPAVVMDTSEGRVILELFPDKSPITTKNFLSYVAEKAYDGNIFHRVIDKFMIQGGGFDQNHTKLPTKGDIKNEAQNGLSNLVGTISMARRQHADSANRQFFINVVDNKRLDYPAYGGGYTVFGKVTEGLDIVLKISRMRTHKLGQFPNLPQTPVIINSIRLMQ